MCSIRPGMGMAWYGMVWGGIHYVAVQLKQLLLVSGRLLFPKLRQARLVDSEQRTRKAGR